MTISHFKSGQRLGALDFVLTAVGSSLAVYSAGMSIETPEIGYFCTGLILVGTLFSYVLSRLGGGSKWLKSDGVLYAIAAICSGVFLKDLSARLPNGGFPTQMGASGTLCWMLIFGSFLSWRDSTLMFQAVPGIALFGLVGCYDTYRNVVFAFYGFLLCLCTGFARAHGREMLRAAADSGYFNRAGIRFNPSAPEQSEELYDAVRRGPWRWVAGPEWALASALAIVLISLLGAPFIQYSVQGVAGFAKIRPISMPRRSPTLLSPGQDDSRMATIGQGPLHGFTGQPVLEAKLDQVRYLRVHTYDQYTSSGWVRSSGSDWSSAQAIESLAIQEIVDPVEIPFEVTPRVSMTSVALPSEVNPNSLSSSRVVLQADDGYGSQFPIDAGQVIIGSFLTPRSLDGIKNTVRPTPQILNRYLDLTDLSPKVAQLANDTVASVRNRQADPSKPPTDRAVADALMEAIVAHARYNAAARAVGNGLDAVDTFLFSQHEGYCDLFASSMVLLSRAAGIPARYVTGYLPDPNDSLKLADPGLGAGKPASGAKNPASGASSLSVGSLYVARDRDYHAWAELFFEDAGWVIYDPTTIASIVPSSQAGASLDTPWYRSEWLRAALNLGCGLLLAGAVWSWLRTRKTAPRVPRNRRADVQREYVSFAKLLRGATGRRRLLNETPGEYLAATKQFLNGSYEVAEKLTKEFETALYSAAPTEEETVAQLQADLRILRSALKQRPKERSR